MSVGGDTCGSRVVGIVLAAGAGSRYGEPKALARDSTGRPWVRSVVETLWSAGIGRVIVILGAQARRAARLVPEGAEVVIAGEWESGMAASLRAGLDAAGEVARGAGRSVEGPVDAESTGLVSTKPTVLIDAALIALVDQSALPVEVVALAVAPPVGGAALRRITYAGRPGHPVLIGRDHWPSLRASLRGDTGAGPWLATQSVEEIPGDRWWDGADIDTRTPGEPGSTPPPIGHPGARGLD